MTKHLRSAKDRENAILNDEPDTKFYFESQKPSDIPGYPDIRIENRIQKNDWGAQDVRTYSKWIDAAAASYSIDPDIVKAIIYTESSRGWYGVPAEWADMVKNTIVPHKGDWFSHTILPGNISPEWEKLIPGSNVHNPKDNIELTTKLIAQIAKRLDDPSIENIYSLYNGLSHDRTYVNKDVKTTPLFAKLAMEAKAWEKDNWFAPELAKEAPPQAVAPVGDASPAPEISPAGDNVVGERFGKWGSHPANVVPQPGPAPASFADRFGTWGSSRQDPEYPRSPVLRELQKYRRSAAPDGSGAQGAPATPAFQKVAVVSPADAAFGNGPIAPTAAAVPSPAAFAARVRSARTQMAGRSDAGMRSLPGLLDEGREAWQGSPSPTATALPWWMSGPLVSDLLGDETQAPMNRSLERYLSSRPANSSPASARNTDFSASEPQDAFTDRLGDRASPAGRASSNSTPSASTPQAAEPLGLVSGQPMQNGFSPLPIWGFPNASTARGGSAGDWFNRWIRPLIEQ